MRKALEQKLADVRMRRDIVATQERGRDIVAFAYRLVAAQGTVDQARKELYIWLRKNGEAVKHKEL